MTTNYDYYNRYKFNGQYFVWCTAHAKLLKTRVYYILHQAIFFRIKSNVIYENQQMLKIF